MNIKTLHNLITLGEGFTVEFKKSGTTNIGRKLCAFANATGGTILIGVTDNGKITGVLEHNKLKSMVQSIAHSIEPPLIVDIESVEKVLAVSVPQQKSKPYSLQANSTCVKVLHLSNLDGMKFRVSFSRKV